MRHISSTLDRIKLGNRITELRGGTSQEQLAEILNNGKQNENYRKTISRWENGRTEISLSNLVKLAAYFNVSLDYITGQIDFVHVGNDDIINSTGLSEKSVETLRKWQKDSQPRTLRDKNGNKMEETAPFSDGLASTRLQMLNFLLENENAVGLLDALWDCIFADYLKDGQVLEFNNRYGTRGLTNEILQNASIPSVTVCIDRLRNISKSKK